MNNKKGETGNDFFPRFPFCLFLLGQFSLTQDVAQDMKVMDMEVMNMEDIEATKDTGDLHTILESTQGATAGRDMENNLV